MNITVIGTGYVGLVVGACFSAFGNKVTCVDLDKEKIENLKQGKLPFYEPGLSDLINKNTVRNGISFTTELKSSVYEAELIFIAVGTPSLGLDGEVDLSYFYAAVTEVAEHIRDNSIIVIKSTVPVGTNRKAETLVNSIAVGKRIFLVSNPEFLREGTAITDFTDPDRVCVGVESDFASEVLSKLYEPITSKGIEMFTANFETIETIKYASNSFLATKIAFINEIASFCDATGADVVSVAKGMGLDERIGDKFLQPGPGYGGSCFPKDSQALAYMGRNYGAIQYITEAVIMSNDDAKVRVFQKINTILEKKLQGRVITILGVTFKANTDDMREAPSLIIVPKLIAEGAIVRVVDPEGRALGESLLRGVEWYEDPYVATQGAELLVILTDWNEFKELSLEQLASVMKEPRLLDARNIFNPKSAIQKGFKQYYGNGRNLLDADNDVSKKAVLESI